ncbi:hypothetical protein BD410DRAFT_348382 [Rickenella mellea]|uniref:DUF6533 domain-containing protein n=1 Tax=Rickenella mellea TaxID=50990 RepID=A0A4Y7QKI6_9AGAM|nr:hypothetical protein BD410DRAFT_348382 [Rickenella mellea]
MSWSRTLANTKWPRYLACRLLCSSRNVWDYLSTFSNEVEFIWPSRWSVAKFLFFLNRYLVFAESTSVVLVEIAFRKPSLQFCHTTTQVASYLSLSGFTIAGLVLMLRTWAIWERNPIVTAVLVAVFFTFQGADMFFTHQYIAGSTPLHVFSNSGCTIIFQNRLIFFGFLSNVLTQSLLVGLLVLKARQYFRNHHTPWLWRVYEDGIFGFFVILVTTMVNALLVLFAPDALHASLIIFQRTIYSVLSTRVIFGIKGAYHDAPGKESTSTSAGVLSTYVAPPLLTQLSEEWSARPNSSLSELADEDFLDRDRTTRRSFVDISDLPVHRERISYI